MAAIPNQPLAPPANPAINGISLYGNGPLPNIVQAPSNLFQGLGASSLINASTALPMQTFNPTQLDPNTSKISNWQQFLSETSGAPGSSNVNQLAKWMGGNAANLLDGYSGTLSGLVNDRNSVLANDSNIQNQNLAGLNTTNAANAKNIGFDQQAAIAQNRLLGELNSRGLLGSFQQGGAGTADMQQLSNSLGNAANDQGVGLQNELSGLNASDAMYQMALQNYNNEVSNFGQQQQNNIPGITDILGLGGSALKLISGL
jgi:hypothetical protein